MKQVVFDIETVGCEFDSLDDQTRDYFTKFADHPDKVAEIKNSLGFYPLTAQVVAIGMLDVQLNEGAVYFQNGGQYEKFQEENVVFISGDEKEILVHFWNQLNRYEQLITFNGRIFDCPFLMLRSAMQHIRVPKNLLPYRYNNSYHIDLADQLTFFDALRRKFSLHIWCKSFGIKSPKEEGITGLQVKDLYKNGQYKEIARYCLRDVHATKELFMYWEKYLKF